MINLPAIVFQNANKLCLNSRNDATTNQQEYLEMHKFLLNVAIALLFFPSLLTAQPQTLNKSNEQAVINTTSKSATDEFPRELLGLWVLDKTASSDFAKLQPRWNPNIEKQFTKLLTINEALVYKISTNQFLVKLDTKEMALPLRFIRKEQNAYYFSLTVNNKELELSITKTRENLLNIHYEGLLGDEFLLWKPATLKTEKS